jgi:GNAT superfamily N-acetyltransferase
MASFIIEALSSNHARASFSCGVAALDRYFQTQVTQDQRRRMATCYVAVDDNTGRIAGFYTLSSGSVLLSALPEDLAKRLPRYPSVPVARLGRFAVDQAYQGQKLGTALLWDALKRASKSELMAYALVVDAKDNQAQNFYLHYNFINFGSVPRQLMFPLSKIQSFLMENKEPGG